MQRRSTARETPRRKYTVDAFAGIPELEDNIDDDMIAEDDFTDDDRDADGNEDDESMMELSDTPRRQNSRSARLPPQPRELKIPGLEQAKQKWSHDPTLPSRIPDIHGRGGFRLSFAQTDEQREQYRQRSWTWYGNEGGLEIFAAHQRIVPLGEEVQINSYIPAAEVREFILGPLGGQQSFRLQRGDSFCLDEAWSSLQLSPTKSTRPGFIVNVGGRIHCMEWIPGQVERTQHLAMSVATTQSMKSMQSDTVSRTTIQLWRFVSNSDGRIDTTAAPALSLLLCFEHRTIQSFKWYPISQSTSTSLGLLAYLANDGNLRVLDVPRASLIDSTIKALLCTAAAFTFSATDSMCTCFTWVSPTRIASGYSDGRVRIWDLAESVPGAATTEPSMIVNASEHHIHSMACHPDHEQTIVIGAFDGRIRSIDLAKEVPSITTVALQSNRITRPLLLAHDTTQTYISSDDSCNVRRYRLAKRKTSRALAKAADIVTSLAGSPAHPHVLVGTAGGDVIVTNPLQEENERHSRRLWQQTWFTHTWRRPKTTEVSTLAQTGSGINDNGPSFDENGLSRFLDGIKAEHVLPGGPASIQVHEEKTTIMALAWNPNLHVAGWAAAAMADGLIRIEDIAV
jgi:transcription factor C subunit 6